MYANVIWGLYLMKPLICGLVGCLAVQLYRRECIKLGGAIIVESAYFCICIHTRSRIYTHI